MVLFPGMPRAEPESSGDGPSTARDLRLNRPRKRAKNRGRFSCGASGQSCVAAVMERGTAYGVVSMTGSGSAAGAQQPATSNTSVFMVVSSLRQK
jgi:hypothetical protein